MPKMDGFELAEKLLKTDNSVKILLLAGMPISHELERAREIGIETIKTHIKNIRIKLDAPNIPSAVRRAYELGVLRI